MLDIIIHEQKKKNYNLLYLSLDSVVQLLGYANHLKSHDKFIYELWSSFLLSVFLIKTKKPIIGIGFPCLKEKIKGAFKLNLKFFKKLIIEYIEFDTVIFYKDSPNTFYYKIQNFRYTHQKEINTNYLFDALKSKKFDKYTKDNELYLLINIEEDIRFDYKALNDKMKTIDIPFASVFAIGHKGLKTDLEYIGLKVYPNIEGPLSIDFRNLKRNNI